MRKFWRRSPPPPPLSRLCPACHVTGLELLAVGAVCATCQTQRAWSDAEAAGGLTIERGAIDEVVRRHERGDRSSLHAGLYASAAISLVAAAVAGWCIYERMRPFELGPLRELVDRIETTTRRELWTGIGCTIVGIVAFVRMRRRAHHRRWTILATHMLAIMVGLTAAVMGGAQTYFSQSGRGLTNMPSRPAPTLASTSDRIIEATVLVLAPADEDGDAKSLGMGTGAVVGRDANRAWIVTCSHVAMPYAAVGSFRVASSAHPVWVQLSDGREGQALVRWTAPPPIDIVLLEFPITNAPEPAELALDTNAIEIGADVQFVPNPYRDGWLVHRGRLLRKDSHKSPAGTFSLLVTDLPVTHGDSGSGLFDSRGRLIGLNTWVQVERDGSHGISLPAETMRILADAIAKGSLGELKE